MLGAMNDLLREVEVFALDCQASGATPEHGDLLELGWGVCAAEGAVGPVHSHWIVPRTERRISRAVRELTGWTEACVTDALSECDAWAALRQDALCLAVRRPSARVPTVIHFARFELPFLYDLYERIGDRGQFPFDAVCLHAVASRLLPDLPRRNIRALAGYLGHSPDLVRRSAGHVEATLFIWRALVPLIEATGITTWQDLKAWLEEPVRVARRSRRVYPLSVERRRALPDAPGVYRFLRRNGDILYVGKATSLKKRVASHFKSRGPMTERGLELLTQVHDLDHVVTESLFEAALFEVDEIKRIDPPYNVQLRFGDRSAWFASKDMREAVSTPDDTHRIGPLPSERSLAPLAALIALVQGEKPSARLRAMALAVPTTFVPDERLFVDGWTAFTRDYLNRPEAATRRVLNASRALWIQRGRSESDTSGDDLPPTAWDLARVRRRLERTLVQTGLLIRRARFLCLLADADVAFRERAATVARCLVISRCEIVERHGFDTVARIRSLPIRRQRTLRNRQSLFDAHAYDRLRVLLTEFRRVLDEGGDVALRIGAHVFLKERVETLMIGV